MNDRNELAARFLCVLIARDDYDPTLRHTHPVSLSFKLADDFIKHAEETWLNAPTPTETVKPERHPREIKINTDSDSISTKS